MKNIKFALFAAVLLAALTTPADILYWMVESPVAGVTLGGNDYAYLYAANQKVMSGFDNTFDNPGAYYYDSGFEAIRAVTDLSGIEGLNKDTKFFVEVYHNDGTGYESIYNGSNVGNLWTLEELKSAGYVRATSSNSLGSYWEATTVPEPTGGVLLLLGLSALALRRKESV